MILMSFTSRFIELYVANNYLVLKIDNKVIAKIKRCIFASELCSAS